MDQLTFFGFVLADLDLEVEIVRRPRSLLVEPHSKSMITIVGMT